jgi:hypothetical protein
MSIDETENRPPYRDRIAILPGDPPVAYRPGVIIVDDAARIDLGKEGTPIFVSTGPGQSDAEPPIGQRYLIEVENPSAAVADLRSRGLTAELDIVYFASGECDCCGCPPHPAMAAELAAEGWGANPWRANPWRANPWRANPWRANPWRANASQMNIVATGRPPTSSVMPAPFRALPLRPPYPTNNVKIGVLDSGLAGGATNADLMRPALLGVDPASLQRISGAGDLPSRPIGKYPVDQYLDPVAGHGTFIAGIIEQLTPGCTITIRKVLQPEGDVSVSTLAAELWVLMLTSAPNIVNLSFGGTGRNSMLELLIDYYHGQHGVVFVGAAGNEGSCVEQYPAALPTVIGVAALGPDGPAPFSNYGSWVDACAPGTDIVSSFFAKFDGATPPINGLDSDDFAQWATWSGTSFAAPVVVAALAREMITGQCTAVEAVERLVNAPHLARLPLMGTVVNY